MNGVVRLHEPDGSVRQLSVAEAVAEASNDLQRGGAAHALRLLDQAVQRAPQAPVVRYLLGMAQLRHDQRDLAIFNLERAVRSDARNVDYLAALGEALIPERPLDAIAYFAAAIELGAKRPDVYSLLASILINVRRPEDALNACDLGLAACGDSPEILGNRGLALRDLARYEEALHYLKKTEALLPHDYRVLVGIGNILGDLGRLAEASDYFTKAAALRPGDPVCRYNLALTLLVAGNLRDGFHEYEWRWGNRQFASHRPRFAQPLWDGANLAGRHLLLSFEQGAGDTIQFARYLQFAKDRGARVTMLVQRPLLRLMTWLSDEVTVTDTPPSNFDVYCPLGSLPRVADTNLESIPAPAQFEIPAITRWQWHARLGERKSARIAIVWAGAAGHLNDHNRSLPLQRLAPLFDLPGAEWFSLQVGPPSAQLAHPGIRDLAPHLTDYAETAAALRQMDLVITVDTSVAHLAGSLGVPTWVLIPFAPDWRWMRDRSDSPWYPSLKLYRQISPGDWDAVLSAVKVDLNAWLEADLDVIEASRGVITEDYSRFAGLSFERFRELARTEGISQYEKTGFPNSCREGKEPAIFADILRKLPNLAKTGQTVLDIGPGCSGLPHLLHNQCRRQQHTLLLADSPEMLQLLPDSAEITKYPGRFPRDCAPLLSEYAGRVDAILSYSVLQYAFTDGGVFDFLDRALGLLAEGGEMLLGDIPNISKRKRFFSSASGVRSHREFTGTNEDPEVVFNRPEPTNIDDSVVLALLARARAASFDAYVLPQHPDLPMANRREDILIRRP